MNNSSIVTCQICGYTTENHQSFNSHITHAHHIKSKDYYDMYIKIFIEINGYWMHGGHFFDENNPEDLATLEKWKSKNTSQYNRAVVVWTKSDLEKHNKAIENNLNYVVLWNKQDITNFINSLIKSAHFH